MYESLPDSETVLAQFNRLIQEEVVRLGLPSIVVDSDASVEALAELL